VRKLREPDALCNLIDFAAPKPKLKFLSYFLVYIGLPPGLDLQPSYFPLSIGKSRVIHHVFHNLVVSHLGV
jgi:hypothetical protein